MAKRKSDSLFPPSPEACEHVVATLLAADEPLTAAELRKYLDPAHGLTEKTLTPILEEAIAQGRLLRLSPRSAKGKPRYWDRDPRTLVRQAVLDAIDRADAPLTARELARGLTLPWKVGEADVTDVLQERLETERLHEIPPTTAKGKPRFWNRSALEWGQAAIRERLQTKGPQAESALRKALKGLDEARFRQALEEGLASRRLWRHPPLTPAGKELLGAAPPSPEPYLRKVAAELRQVVGQCLAADMPRDGLRRALVQLIEAAGIPFSAGASAAAADDGNLPIGPGVDLVALMRQIEPGADRGALVGARDLRRAARLEKRQFDRAVLDLARQGRLSLHRHDFVASLAPEEQDDLVTDGRGNYYVGVALRQNPA